MNFFLNLLWYDICFIVFLVVLKLKIKYVLVFFIIYLGGCGKFRGDINYIDMCCMDY